MRAIVFLGPRPEEEAAALDGGLLDAFDRLSSAEMAGAGLAAAAAGVALALGVYALTSRLIARRPYDGSPANSLGESCLGVALLVMAGDLLVRMLAAAGWENVVGRLAASTGALLVSVIFLGSVSAERRAGRFPWWGLRRPGIGAFLLVIPVIFLAFVPLAGLVVVVWRVALHALDAESGLQAVLTEPLEEGGWTLGCAFAAVVTVIPVLEEIVFRGALYRSARAICGPWLGALISALIFAACHGNLSVLAPIFVLALFLAFVYEWTGTLWAPVGVHAMFNFLNFGLA
jgi:membrane protease YdiL (CAAX protease family)